MKIIIKNTPTVDAVPVVRCGESLESNLRRSMKCMYI